MYHLKNQISSNALQFFTNSFLFLYLLSAPLIAEDRILQVMPNVILALHLLNEKYNEQSFWKPYIGKLQSFSFDGYLQLQNSMFPFIL